jgi:hypothetical protein
MLVRGIDMAASWVVSSDNWHQLGLAAVELARPRHLTPGQFSFPFSQQRQEHGAAMTQCLQRRMPPLSFRSPLRCATSEDNMEGAAS